MAPGNAGVAHPDETTDGSAASMAPSTDGAWDSAGSGALREENRATVDMA